MLASCCRYLALQEEYEGLEERWQNRGPREEDALLIEQLQLKNSELTELVSLVTQPMCTLSWRSWRATLRAFERP